MLHLVNRDSVQGRIIMCVNAGTCVYSQIMWELVGKSNRFVSDQTGFWLSWCKGQTDWCRKEPFSEEMLKQNQCAGGRLRGQSWLPEILTLQLSLGCKSSARFTRWNSSSSTGTSQLHLLSLLVPLTSVFGPMAGSCGVTCSCVWCPPANADVCGFPEQACSCRCYLKVCFHSRRRSSVCIWNQPRAFGAHPCKALVCRSGPHFSFFIA